MRIRAGGSRNGQVGPAIVRSVGITAAGAAAAAVWTIRGGAGLPRIMLDEYRFVPEWPYVVGAPVAVLCMLALVVLWFRRRSILDLFLMVVLCAFLIEIPPHYYPFPARFSHRLVRGAGHQPAVEQHRAGGAALRDHGALRRAPRCGASPAARTGGAPDDRGCRRCIDRP